MYNSLKTWMNIPYSYKRCIGRNGTGSKQFGSTKSGLCYASGEEKNIVDSTGVEKVSMKQLYVDGNTDIAEADVVLFEGSETNIKAIGYFYQKGAVDIKVVYL